ncbi:hypothetical protein SDIAM26S_02855 [Streptomyces diastaticus subsp. diastaticus]
MGLDGGLGEDEVGGDLAVGEALGDEDHHLALPAGEPVQSGVPGGGGRVGEHRREPVEEAARGRRRDHGVTAVHGTDRGEQFGRRNVLEHEPAGTGPEAGEGVLVQVEGGQDQHLRRVLGGADPPGGLHPVQARHPHVHQHHVDGGGPQHLDRLGAVARLPDHLHVRLGREHHAEAGAQKRLVVHEHHADRRHANPFPVLFGSCVVLLSRAVLPGRCLAEPGRYRSFPVPARGGLAGGGRSSGRSAEDVTPPVSAGAGR